MRLRRLLNHQHHLILMIVSYGGLLGHETLLKHSIRLIGRAQILPSVGYNDTVGSGWWLLLYMTTTGKTDDSVDDDGSGSESDTTASILDCFDAPTGHFYKLLLCGGATVVIIVGTPRA